MTDLTHTSVSSLWKTDKGLGNAAKENKIDDSAGMHVIIGIADMLLDVKAVGGK